MSLRRRILADSALIACLLALACGGVRGGAGMAVGLVATGLSVYGWWPVSAMIGQVASASRAEPGGRRSGGRNSAGSALVILIFLAKLPVFLLLALAARRLGGAAIPCFLAGVGLVYSALIGWGLSLDACAE